MKVLLTTDTKSGIWKYSIKLCNELKKYGVQVHLVAMGGWPSPFQQMEIEKMSNVLLYKSDFKLEWMKESWDDLEPAKKWINSIYQTVKPDILHLNNYAHIEENWTAPVVTSFHTGTQTWWQAAKGNSAPKLWDQYISTVKQSLESVDLLGHPTPRMLEKFLNMKQAS